MCHFPDWLPMTVIPKRNLTKKQQVELLLKVIHKYDKAIGQYEKINDEFSKKLKVEALARIDAYKQCISMIQGFPHSLRFEVGLGW